MATDEPEASQPEPTQSDNAAESSRRRFVTGACAATMGGALLAGYGTFFSYAGRYLYPSKPAAKGWMFVTEAAAMKLGDSLTYRTPAGAPVAIARQGETGEIDDFIALSSRCPHLGCAVHWEGQNDRFFCPCHNGVFDPKGQAVSGPPADANQPLPRFPLKLDSGLLFIEVELESLPNGTAINSPDGNEQLAVDDVNHDDDRDENARGSTA